LDLSVGGRDLGMPLSFFQLCCQGARIKLFGRYVLERGSDLLLIDSVAIETALALHHVGAGLRQNRSGRNRTRNRHDQPQSPHGNALSESCSAGIVAHAGRLVHGTARPPAAPSRPIATCSNTSVPRNSPSASGPA